jgi:uroporphyrinogen-III synthase
MSQALQGRLIALAEGRQLDELAGMLQAEGATTLPCPMLQIVDAPDQAPVLAWLNDLAADRFSLVVLMTGEALRRLMGFADRAGVREQVLAALARTHTLTRGPKPVKALQEIGLTPTRVASAPTTAGVIASLRDEDLRGKTVGVTLFGSEIPPELEEFITSSGGKVRTVLPYVYGPGASDEEVVRLIREMAQGKVDVLVITSSPQVDRLFAVAESAGEVGALGEGFRRTRLAAVGPIAAESLERRKVEVAICPEKGFVMKNLVQHIKRALGA